jgi:large-conductance mechanosensitive channel
VHELLGHGVSAWLLGGTFEGLALMPDGMGWAAAYSPDHPNLVLASGVIAGVAFGLLMVSLAYNLVHPIVRLTCLLFATCSLQDALPYAFWNSVFPRPPGDFGRILLDLQSEALRWLLVIGFGIAYLAASLGCNLALFRTVQSVVGRLTKTQAAVLAYGVFGIGGGITWFGFDWNQLIEGIGRLPQFVGAGLQLATAPLLVAICKHDAQQITVPARVWTVAIATAWFVAAALIFVLVAWLQHGVYWSTRQ